MGVENFTSLRIYLLECPAHSESLYSSLLYKNDQGKQVVNHLGLTENFANWHALVFAVFELPCSVRCIYFFV